MHVITRLIVGGSQELVLLTCRDQLRRGHEVVLVYGRTEGPEGSMVGEANNLPGLTLREVRSMLPDVSIHDWHAYRQLRQLVARHQPDVVHTHTFKAGVLGRYAAARLHVPCVTHTVHGSRFYEEQSPWQNSVVVRSERGAARRCHRILCVSKALQHRFLAAGIGRPAQYRVVYSGLELGRYQHTARARVECRRMLGLEDDDFVIGTVARLAKMKGHEDLLTALYADLQSNPRLKLLWVGDGPEHPALKAAVVARCLDRQVVFAGNQPPYRVPFYVAAMDTMAHPSYREGFPLAVVHAMLCGVPAIAYDVDGPREIIVHGESGFLLRKGDIAGLKRSALALHANPESRRRLGQNAREAATTRCDHLRMVSEIESTYEEVIRGL
jgi:glycosyltransferase involved in cell wall biosynthesis